MYIYDYLIKRNLQASAKAFLNEGKVSSDPVGMYSLSTHSNVYLRHCNLSVTKTMYFFSSY